MSRHENLVALHHMLDHARETGGKEDWSRLAKSVKAETDEQLIEACKDTVSLPFEPGDNQRIAVKIIDDRGIESPKIIEVA